MKIFILSLFLAFVANAENVANPLFDIFGNFMQGNVFINQASYYNSLPNYALLSNQLSELLETKDYINNVANEFNSKFNKQYNTATELNLRTSILKANILKVFEHNADAAVGKKSYTMSINQFSDLSTDEIINSYTGYWPSNNERVESNNVVDSYKRKRETTWWVDPYRATEVTPIQNQGSCGACVYFAAAAVVESSWAIRGNTLTVLSPQQLNDCARDEKRGNHGCASGGGTFVPTFDYIKAHGLTSMSNYPYLEKDADCNKAKEAQVVAKISNWGHVTPAANETALLNAFNSKGPIAVAIHVNDNWAHYKSGIYDDECSGGRNHAVLVVGYGHNETLLKDYWIVKNQWGPSFGENGYIRMRRNKNNMCDIAGDAVWVS